MTQNKDNPHSLHSSPVNLRRLVACGILSWLLYLLLLSLSSRFAWGTSQTSRPLPMVLGVLAVLFALYLVSVASVFRGLSGTWATPLIILFSVAFRLVMLFSAPIQEIDPYRYIWDGKVCAAGVNPFLFSPEQVLSAVSGTDLPVDLQTVVELRDRSSANAEILARIHYKNLTTIYPPVSQAVFAAVAMVTPHASAVSIQMLIMKSAIVLFDVGTLGLLILLLRTIGRPTEWSIVYGWCPLVIKEFANSGHLDSIAVLLTTAALLCGVRAFFGRSALQLSDTGGTHWLWISGVIGSLAVGAKIYPIVLFPLLFLTASRRLGIAVAAAVAAAATAICVLIFLPMLARAPRHRDAANGLSMQKPASVYEDPSFLSDFTEVPTDTHRPPADDRPDTGLAAFASRWQMNDFLFLLLLENLRPARHHTPAAPRDGEHSELHAPPRPDVPVLETVAGGVDRWQPTDAWFVVTSDQWRQQIARRCSVAFGIPSDDVPFRLTRWVTSGIFVVLAVGFAVSGLRRDDPAEWLRSAFLTIAWFWLLQPVQNPWYWSWAMSLVVFARSKAWLAVSGCVLIYYLRFWLLYHYKEASVLGTAYAGADFFDYCVTWIEFGPLLLWLALCQLRSLRKEAGGRLGPGVASRIDGRTTQDDSYSHYNTDKRLRRRFRAGLLRDENGDFGAGSSKSV